MRDGMFKVADNIKLLDVRVLTAGMSRIDVPYFKQNPATWDFQLTTNEVQVNKKFPRDALKA